MNQKPEDQLLESLLTEMAQTEESAIAHPRKEAARYDAGEAPALALLAVSDHAERAITEVESLAGGSPGLGKAIGKTLSALRDKFGDKLISREKSYRGTLLGLQHGLDCALLTQSVATVCGRTDVVRFCDRWLDERRPLVTECQRAVSWFATHPILAMERAG